MAKFSKRKKIARKIDAESFIENLQDEFMEAGKHFEYEPADIVSIQNYRTILQERCRELFNRNKINRWTVECSRRNNTEKSLANNLLRAKVSIQVLEAGDTYELNMEFPCGRVRTRGWFNNKKD